MLLLERESGVFTSFEVNSQHRPADDADRQHRPADDADGGSNLRARAIFLESVPPGVSISPFVGGELNERLTRVHEVVASPLAPVSLSQGPCAEAAARDFVRRGSLVVGLQRTLSAAGLASGIDVCETTLHARLREAVHAFWNGEGAQLLDARFGHNSSCSQQSASLHQRAAASRLVLPTHVTERRAPPDAMRLAHIDYPPSIGLEQLASEWWSRWRACCAEHNVASPQELAGRYHLAGVVTLWMCLSESIQDQPLLVADAATVSHEDLTVYAVQRSSRPHHQPRELSAAARHSVGVHFNPKIEWHHVPAMCWGDAWAFDTQRSPHVAVDLGRHPTFVRHSAEVRSLILHPISTDAPSSSTPFAPSSSIPSLPHPPPHFHR
jgi:hypothetical protein